MGGCTMLLNDSLTMRGWIVRLGQVFGEGCVVFSRFSTRKDKFSLEFEQIGERARSWLWADGLLLTRRWRTSKSADLNSSTVGEDFAIGCRL